MAEDRFDYVAILEDILINSISFSDIKNKITAEQRHFCNMLFLTLFRQLTFIKKEVLPQFVKKKIPHKQRCLEFILYLAVTELLFLNTPDYAVINSYTEIAKKKTNQFGANFINAILRHVSRQKEFLLKNRHTLYFSDDFMKILKQDYTAAEIAEMENFAAIEPPLDITLKNNISIPFDDYLELPTGSIRLSANTKVKDIPGYLDGSWWVQDAAAALPVKCFSDFKGKYVLDLCAAPGGKTAQLLDAGAFVTAVDISETRLQRLKENISRLKLEKNLQLLCADALSLQLSQKFDIILLDAPCSATGTYRRHPEILHTKTPTDVKKQALLQQKILEHSIQLLKENGILIYATCSLAKAEGERQIRQFLSHHTNFSVLPISLNGTDKMRTKEGFLRILPQHFKEFSGIDGFFIAILQRKI